MSNTNFSVLDFLNKNYFEKVLKNGLKVEDIEIVDLQISTGSAHGENFSSVISRAVMKYRMNPYQAFRNISLIVKSTKRDNKESPASDGYQKESAMYLNILPRIEKLYGNVETFGPKLYYANKEQEYDNIVMEDLVASGYSHEDRIKRMDETHTKAVLQKLGKFHAASVVLREKEPSLFEVFDKGFFQLEGYDLPVFQSIYVRSVEQVIELLTNWGEFDMADKLKRIYRNFRQKVKSVLSPKPNDIRVLTHADLWTNNIFFKQSNGNITNVNLIDLLCTTNSLAIDLHYFLNMSVQNVVLKNKRDELYQTYYDAFRGGLEQLNYSKIPSWDDVRNEILGKEFFGFMVVVGEHPIAVLDREASKDATFDTISDSRALWEKRAIVYSTPDYQEFLKFSIERFNHLGVFD